MYCSATATSDRRLVGGDARDIDEGGLAAADVARQKGANWGFRGYPVGTIAFYGPDAERASR